MNTLKDNGIKLSPSNGDSADLVARGEFAFSLVDSDDVRLHAELAFTHSRDEAQEIGMRIIELGKSDLP